MSLFEIWGRDDEHDEDDDEPLVIDVDMLSDGAREALAERMRAFLLDIKVPDFESVLERLGIPTDEESLVLDIEASEERASRLAPLRTLMHNFAHITADSVAVTLQEDADFESESTREVLRMLLVLLEFSIYIGIYGSVSQMEDMGLITYNWEDEK
jgi:hypothetical protein